MCGRQIPSKFALLPLRAQVVLGVKNSNELLKFAKKLEDAGMLHRVWVRRPHL